MKEKYILCADVEGRNGRWELPVLKGIYLKEEYLQELTDSFYIKGDGVFANTIMFNFNCLDILLGILCSDALFLIPVSQDEVIVRRNEAVAKEELISLNSHKDNKQGYFELYKYTPDTLQRVTD